MVFWGVTLSAGQTYTHEGSDEFGDRFHLSQATLGLNSSESRRVLVKAKGEHHESPIVICSLKEGAIETCSLDLVFEGDVEFSLEGESFDGTVHLAGYYMPENEESAYREDDEDEDFEGEEEDEQGLSEEEDEDERDGMEDFAAILRNKMKGKRGEMAARQFLEGSKKSKGALGGSDGIPSFFEMEAEDDESEDEGWSEEEEDEEGEGGGDGESAFYMNEDDEDEEVVLGRTRVLSNSGGVRIVEITEEEDKGAKEVEKESEKSKGEKSAEKKKGRKEKKQAKENGKEVEETIVVEEPEEEEGEEKEGEAVFDEDGVRVEGGKKRKTIEEGEKSVTKEGESGMKKAKSSKTESAKTLPSSKPAATALSSKSPKSMAHSKPAVTKPTSVPDSKPSTAGNATAPNKPNATLASKPAVDSAAQENKPEPKNKPAPKGAKLKAAAADAKRASEKTPATQAKAAKSEAAAAKTAQLGKAVSDTAKAEADKAQKDKKEAAPKAAATGKPVAGNVKKFPNGLEVGTVALGPATGKVAKRGCKLEMSYIGRLKKNGKIFDSNVGKKPFTFRLGVGEVIKGWDLGLEGMRVGDKRKLVIPPQMAYGAKGVPGTIPANAWLEFDVELKQVK